MADRWIVIPNWDRFQHYRNRDPAWIKLHRSLASDPAWIGLSGHCRAVLIGLWLEYASSHCQVAVNTSSLTRRLSLRVSSRQLKTLETAGLIEISASKPLAPRYSRGREEIETPTPSAKRKGRASRNGRPLCPHCGLELAGPVSLEEHLSNVHYELEEVMPSDA